MQHRKMIKEYSITKTLEICRQTIYLVYVVCAAAQDFSPDAVIASIQFFLLILVFP